MGSPFYKQKDFRTEKLAALQGLMSDRKANRVLNRYMKSEAGQQAEADFAKAESDKYLASVDAFIQEGKDRRAAISKPVVTPKPTPTPISTPTPAPTPAPKLVNAAYWNSRANKFGFNNMDDVKAWQQQNGLVADGMFGRDSEAKWRSMQQQASNPKLVSKTVTSVDGTPMDIVRKNASTVETESMPAANPVMTEEQFRTHKNFRNIYGSPKNRTITIEGKEYPIMASTGLLGNNW